MKALSVKKILDQALASYHRPDFIVDDPISVPHGFSGRQDIEIAGFFAAIFAWGQRVTIINKCKHLMALMDNAPYEFICGHTELDLKRMEGFVHRTFNDTDLLYFIQFLRHHYQKHQSLEDAFLIGLNPDEPNMRSMLIAFRAYFFSLEYAPARTTKHIATPASGSSCKRLNMYLRWMVRTDGKGVDFGLWKNIQPAWLICPLDVHVGRVARKLGLLQHKQDNWEAAEALTQALAEFCHSDPVKYDIALFGLGVSRTFF